MREGDTKSCRRRDGRNADRLIAADRRRAAGVAESGGRDALDRLSITLEHVCGILLAHLDRAPDGREREVVDRLFGIVGNAFVAVRLERLLHQAPNRSGEGEGARP